MTPNYPNIYPLYYDKVNIFFPTYHICHNFLINMLIIKYFICRLGNCSLPMDNPSPSHLTVLMSQHAGRATLYMLLLITALVTMLKLMMALAPSASVALSPLLIMLPKISNITMEMTVPSGLLSPAPSPATPPSRSDSAQTIHLHLLHLDFWQSSAAL